MQAIIIAAGHGSRLLPLTLTTPKCLVAVDGRAILDHQLDALAAAGFAGATIVGGYRIEQVAAHLDARAGGLPTTLAFNPFWAVANSIGSVWAARDHLTAPFALMNGDTLFDPTILQSARDAGSGVTLIVERLAEAGLDDMLVHAEHGRVTAVGKHLCGDTATDRSLGLIVSGGGTAYADALCRVIARDDGIHAYHHAVVQEAAIAGDGVRALRVAPDARWQEIDRPEDIVLWERSR